MPRDIDVVRITVWRVSQCNMKQLVLISMVNVTILTIFMVILHSPSPPLVSFSCDKSPLPVRASIATPVCDSAPPPHILIIVNSAAVNFERRNAIRETWGNVSFYSEVGVRLKILFLVGQLRIGSPRLLRVLLEDETRRGDILTVNCADTYKNNIFKHMAGVDFVVHNCPRVKVVFKTDDDVFVDVVRALSTYQTHFQDSMWCDQQSGQPIRNPDSKWFVDRRIFGNGYPPYCMGSFYAISNTSLKRVHEKLICEPYFWIDDVHVTGLARTQAGVEIKHVGDERQSYFRKPPVTMETVDAVTKGRLKMLYHHNILPRVMKLIWDRHVTRGRGRTNHG